MEVAKEPTFRAVEFASVDFDRSEELVQSLADPKNPQGFLDGGWEMVKKMVGKWWKMVKNGGTWWKNDPFEWVFMVFWWEMGQKSWVMTDVPIFHITQPWSVYGQPNGYYKVMSNIPKMGQLPTPENGEKWIC